MTNIADELAEKEVTLILRGVKKLTIDPLAKAIGMYIDRLENKALDRKFEPGKYFQGKGKQAVKHLLQQGQGESTITIANKESIKAFEHSAKKFGVDYAVMRDKSNDPPNYLVFFKAKDSDAIMSAFRDFSAKQLNKTKAKVSVIGALEKAAKAIDKDVAPKQYQRIGYER